MEYVCYKHIEFYFLGAPGTTRDSQRIDSRDLSKITVPVGAFGFTFYDILQATVKHEGDTAFLISGKTNESPMHYYGGKVYTIDEFKELFPEEETIIRNAIDNEWKGIIKCRTGNSEPFLENHVFIPLGE